MNPVRRKMISFLTEAAHKEIEALDPVSQYAKEVSEIDDIEKTIAEETEKICNAATLAEITRILFLVARMEKMSGKKKEAIEDELKRIAEDLVKRAEAQSGPLRLRGAFRSLLSGP